jgi:adenylate kinase family enzyme
MRIHIIGGSGSGKTFISNQLCQEYNYNLIDLDKLEWVNTDNGTVKRDVKEKKKLLKKELKKDNIILEGVYYNWCIKSFEQCDYIFYLNVPLLKQEYRIIRRSIRRKLGIEKSFFKETIKSIYDLMKWNIKYNTKLKKDIFNILDKYKDKVYNVSNYDEIKKILEGGKKMRDLSIMVDDVKFNYRAGLLIEKGNKVLVECNPDIDFVTLPGGRVQTLESSMEALQREIKEEMNIKLDPKEIKMRALIENFFEMDGKKYHELYFLYKLKVTSNDKRFTSDMKNIDSKASYYKWVKKDELDKANLLPVILREVVKTNKFENIVINDLKK